MASNKTISASKVRISKPTVPRVRNVTVKTPKDYKASPSQPKDYGNISFGLTGRTGRT